MGPKNKTLYKQNFRNGEQMMAQAFYQIVYNHKKYHNETNKIVQ
jgi:hypothetical protein